MEFRLLGPVTVLDGGRHLPIGGPMPRATLALLLLRAGRVVTTDQLVDALWDDEPPPSAVQTVRAYVSRLRRVLQDDADASQRLRSHPPGYVLHVQPGELDARTFEVAARAGRRMVARADWAAAAGELRAALELWDGPALAGLEGFPALAGDAGRLEELRLQALTDRLEADVALGRHAEVTPELEQLVTEHPYREQAWLQLMLALYRSGRQKEALTTYQRARRMLLDELGVEPGPELRGLEMAILRQDPSLELAGTSPSVSIRLPAERTTFVGRTRELVHLERLMVESHMVTMTGVGGSGKTRLALRATHDAGNRYPDGVWWAELAELTDPHLVPQKVAEAVGVSAAESKSRQVADVLVGFLADREALLVLDNCEHLAAATAQIADSILDRCPRMHILATSREPLSVEGEVVVPVLPLEVPPEGAPSPADYAAVRLFLDRARSADPGFATDPDALEQIAAICRRLEGIPLAIELAAARAKMLSPAEIANRLEGHLDLVSGGPRTALPRHRSLRATLDWSFDLLDSDEQALLCRASVFVGGFSLEAVGEVATPGEDATDVTLEPLTALVDRSLVQISRRGQDVRYRLLEPVRQYALDRLLRAEDADAVRARHAGYFLRLAEEGDAHLRGPQQGTWLEKLDAEHANLRAALAWALDAGHADLALRLTASLGWYWLMRGHWAEARRWLDRALAAAGGSELARAQAIYRTGAIDIIRVNLAGMPQLVQESLEVCRREGDEWGVAWCQHLLGHAALYRKADQHLASELLEAGLQAFRSLGDEWGYAWSLRYVAATPAMDSDPERAIPLHHEAIQRFRELGDLWSAAFALYGLGSVLVFHHRPVEARSALVEARELCRVLGDEVMAAHAMRGLAMLNLVEGDLEAAAVLFREARGVFHRAGDENCHALCSQYLGVIELDAGDIASARRELAAAMAGHRSIGREDAIGQVLAWLAVVDLADGDARRAAVLMGSSRWLEGLPVGALHDVVRARIEAAEVEIRRRLPNAEFRRAWSEGERMSREEAIRFALGQVPTTA